MSDAQTSYPKGTTDMTTIDLASHDLASHRISRALGTASRIARAVRRWLTDLRRPMSRDQVVRRMAIQREAQRAMAQHGHAYHGQFVTMRQRLELS